MKTKLFTVESFKGQGRVLVYMRPNWPMAPARDDDPNRYVDGVQATTCFIMRVEDARQIRDDLTKRLIELDCERVEAETASVEVAK
jgi:hypothetical protein